MIKDFVNSLLINKFEMKNMDELHYFLGIKIIHIPHGILLSKWNYIFNLLFKFGMKDCKPITTPFDNNLLINSENLICV